jgi:hypothetical protein
MQIKKCILLARIPGWHSWCGIAKRAARNQFIHSNKSVFSSKATITSYFRFFGPLGVAFGAINLEYIVFHWGGNSWIAFRSERFLHS